MSIEELIKELERIKQAFGNIPVQLQETPRDDELVTGSEQFFVVPEPYTDGTVCNIRIWPY